MIDEFIMRVALAGIGVAVVAGPLGCFVLWRRMVYFGDTISHAALLGVAFALALDLPVILGVLLVAVGVSLIILMAGERKLHTDTLLGISAHSALAVGLVAVSLLGSVNVDLVAYLIGDILSVNWTDVAIIWIGAALCLGLLAWRWQPLLLTALSPDIARARAMNPARENLLYTLALAILVAVAIKVVGALLITALLIIPAATARLIAPTPERMVILAALCGAFAALLGMAGSFGFDTPTGPTIVVAALVILLATGVAVRIFRPAL